MQGEIKSIQLITRFDSIHIEELFVNDKIDSEDIDRLNPKDYIFDSNINVEVIQIKKQIMVRLAVSVFPTKDRKFDLGKIITKGVFTIENFDVFVKNGVPEIPNQILAMYVGILFSTTRGLFWSKMENTILEGVMLPIIDPKSFFKDTPSLP